VVARSAESFVVEHGPSAGEIRGTVLLALGSCLLFALTIFTADRAVPVFGSLQTLWVSRLISLFSILLLFGLRRRRPRVPVRWWPLLAVQGLLDTSGYVALYAAGHSEQSSAFGAVTTLLAWMVLREKIGPSQWLGIVLIFAGVAVLSA
jgi:drug/metabolite transporter (DMT)-like permease